MLASRDSGAADLRGTLSASRYGGNGQLPTFEADQSGGLMVAAPTNAVMAGLDPAIHPLKKAFFRRWMDTRVKPAYDGLSRIAQQPVEM
jgi:hypothetical protein